jgi:putative copper resistance protein D
VTLSPLWDLAFSLALLVTATLYYRAKPISYGISRGRQSLFGVGIALAAIVLIGPIPHIATKNFTFHMIQHIALMMVIAPLIILGSPFRILRIDQSFMRYLLKAEVGFVIFLIVLIATHFSPLANAGMRNPNIHSLELVLFVIGGLIYYYPVMEGNPQPFHVAYSTRVLSLFAMMLPETMTGFFLYSGNRMVHSLPSSVSLSQGLHQQRTGGAIMWAMGMAIDTIWIVLAAKDWFTSEARLAELEDAHE